MNYIEETMSGRKTAKFGESHKNLIGLDLKAEEPDGIKSHYPKITICSPSILYLTTRCPSISMVVSPPFSASSR